MADEKKCVKCGFPLNDQNTCVCESDICIFCCSCPSDCSCGCQDKARAAKEGESENA